MDGAYEVLWQAPDRFREEFGLGPFSESDVAVPGKLYVRRNTPVPALALWRLRTLTGLPTSKAVISVDKIAKVLPQKNSAGSVWCFELAPPSLAADCVEPLSGRLISMGASAKNGLGGFSEDHFISVGSSNYATHMLSTIGTDSIEVNVDELDQVDGFADGIFSPPNGATSSDWCPNPSVAKDDGQELRIWTSIAFGSGFPPPRTHDLTGYYLKVGTDGGIEFAAEMHPDGTARRVDLVGANNVRLPVHSCAGKPIGYETIMGGPISR